jgi:hypothetical protein
MRYNVIACNDLKCHCQFKFKFSLAAIFSNLLFSKKDAKNKKIKIKNIKKIIKNANY